MDSNLPPIGPGSRDEGSTLKDQATNISQRLEDETFPKLHHETLKVFQSLKSI